MTPREIRVWALQRSGQHAVCGWIHQQLVMSGQPSLLINDPIRQFAEDPQGFRGELAQILAADGGGDGRHVVFNVEDRLIGDGATKLGEAEKETALGKRAVTNVLLLRDPWNLFASRLKYGRPRLDVEAAVKAWRQHARVFNKPGIEKWCPVEFIEVNYNLWARWEPYRRHIAGELGLVFTDAGIDDVPDFGGGSSFDGMELDGRAGEMAILDRWKSIAKDWYVEHFDAEIVRLSRKIFGDVVPHGWISS